MTNEEIKSLSEEDLNERLVAEQSAFTKMKFAHAISPIENPMKIRDSRRFIARLKTELHARKKAATN